MLYIPSLFFKKSENLKTCHHLYIRKIKLFLISLHNYIKYPYVYIHAPKNLDNNFACKNMKVWETAVEVFDYVYYNFDFKNT